MLGRISTLALMAALSLAACGPHQAVSRSGTTDKPPVAMSSTATPVAYDVARVNVIVPRKLRVSEANSFVPVADIVWHGDPARDRYNRCNALWRMRRPPAPKT